MKILLTGAFGNLGAFTLEILLAQGGHDILCFDIQTPQNVKTMKRLASKGRFETYWGNISDPDIIPDLVEGKDCILHLAGIIPPPSEKFPDLVQKVNVEGTQNLVNAAVKLENKPKFIFTSSVTVHGNMYSTPPPRHADEPIKGTDNYTHSKIAGEKFIRESGVPYTILRVAAAMPLDMMERDIKTSMTQLFEIPYDQRIEAIHPRDVATGIVNSITADTVGKILYLGGGKDCQMLYCEFIERLLGSLGMGMPPKSAFRQPKDNSEYWYTDYMDTEESQKLLKFQNNSFDDFLKEMNKDFGWKGFFTKLFNPIIGRFILRYSAYYKQ